MGGSSSKQESSSTNTSLSQAIQGNNNGVVLSGDGNAIDVVTTDLGAMDAARNITELGTNMVGDLAAAVGENNRLALQESGDLARDLLSSTVGVVDVAMADNTSLANNAIGEAGRVFDSAGNVLNSMALTLSDTANNAFDLSRYSIAEGNSLARDGFDLSRDAIDAQSDLAQSAMSLSQSVSLDGANLARDLAAINASQSGEQLRDFYATMQNTTDKALQFADNASRSDGQQLAIDANNTLKWVMMGGLAVAGVFAVGKLKQ